VSPTIVALEMLEHVDAGGDLEGRVGEWELGPGDLNIRACVHVRRRDRSVRHELRKHAWCSTDVEHCAGSAGEACYDCVTFPCVDGEAVRKGQASERAVPHD
jgi:hypothetical protein